MQFIENPLVKWNLHNGATKQYTGLSHSLDEDGQEVMKCYESTKGYEQVVDAIRQLASHRVNSMALLGTTRGFKDLGRLLAHLSNISLTQTVDPSRQRAAQARNRGERKDPYYDDQEHSQHSQPSRRRRRLRSLLRDESESNPPRPRRMTLAKSMGQCLANTQENYKVLVSPTCFVCACDSSFSTRRVSDRAVRGVREMRVLDDFLVHGSSQPSHVRVAGSPWAPAGPSHAAWHHRRLSPTLTRLRCAGVDTLTAAACYGAHQLRAAVHV